jgi:hypothetical protein
MILQQLNNVLINIPINLKVNKKSVNELQEHSSPKQINIPHMHRSLIASRSVNQMYV